MLALGLRFARQKQATCYKTALCALKDVGLHSWANHKPSELSGGMQQRVGLARCLATGSRIFLMDEPFSALDPPTRAQLQKHLFRVTTTA